MIMIERTSENFHPEYFANELEFVRAVFCANVEVTVSTFLHRVSNKNLSETVQKVYLLPGMVTSTIFQELARPVLHPDDLTNGVLRRRRRQIHRDHLQRAVPTPNRLPPPSSSSKRYHLLHMPLQIPPECVHQIHQRGGTTG